MRILRNTFDNIWAAFIFFTRLPLWRIYQPPKDCYAKVVEFWPLVGWLTGAVMGSVLYITSFLFPFPMPVVLAIASRVLLTGALHEDGLCDFFDGFGGGGNDKQRILDIMKDSRVGTYGIVGLILYFLLLVVTLNAMGPTIAAVTIFGGDAFSKMVSAQLIMQLPYARTQEQSKAKVVYSHITTSAGIGLAIQGLLPMIPMLLVINKALRPEVIILVPCLVIFFLPVLMPKKTGGYTGSGCGASFLLCELSFYITVGSFVFINYGLISN